MTELLATTIPWYGVRSTCHVSPRNYAFTLTGQSRFMTICNGIQNEQDGS
ncbi:MAG: hypothetical protein K9J17_09250 [Flavobacteriales bacterium]|nr:hypothetical protein [Flavobacteriales bacterium]